MSSLKEKRQGKKTNKQKTNSLKKAYFSDCLTKYRITYVNASDLVLPPSKCIHSFEKQTEIYQFAATFAYEKMYIKHFYGKLR